MPLSQLRLVVLMQPQRRSSTSFLGSNVQPKKSKYDHASQFFELPWYNLDCFAHHYIDLSMLRCHSVLLGRGRPIMNHKGNVAMRELVGLNLGRFNATTQKLVMRVGAKGSTTQVVPGGTQRYRISAEKGKGAAVSIATVTGNTSKLFYSTYWPVYQDKRSLVLFVPDGKKIRVKRISDKINPPKEEES